MKVRLKAGEWIDTLTGEELDKALEKLVDRLQPELPRTIRGPGQSGDTDAGGGVEFIAYRVPAGCRFVLHRILVRAEGYSSSAPFTTAGVSIDIYRGESDASELVDFSAGQIPAVIKDGSGAGYTFMGDETVTIVVTGGPANARITATPVGKLYRGGSS